MTSKQQWRESSESYRAKLNKAEAIITAANQWRSDMMKRHQPYISGRIDVSGSPAADMRADFIGRIERNIWCTECRTPFPCREVSNLRQLREVLRFGDYAGLPTPDKAPQKGQIETAM